MKFETGLARTMDLWGYYPVKDGTVNLGDFRFESGAKEIIILARLDNPGSFFSSESGTSSSWDHPVNGRKIILFLTSTGRLGATIETFLAPAFVRYLP